MTRLKKRTRDRRGIVVELEVPDGKGPRKDPRRGEN